ncbi:type III pantothenate kinase [Alkalicoccobacillus plakortidis]|uniref:Type III pantothenate kinase n=1 Tax=Alkalicoccobacillus plakortidis TaxID=444060 RepID=A0ABT0XP85_9BACI|nr:type III pantothenate kinase [Alkalicoccobacillus plakortidis]MCM2677718.1 type III pantothenate kinase [Alkalicoccobacillus plakortidis]
MILVMDVGNSTIVLGVYKEDVCIRSWRIATDRQKTSDEYAVLIRSMFADEGISFSDIKGISVSSVVPPIMHTLEQMCKVYLGQKALVIGPGVKTGLNILYENPREVGSDRIANAVGALTHYGSPVVIVDFGTATTYCYINDKEQYVGGAIAPGMAVAAEALYMRASKLPKIELAKPKNILGRNTIHAVQAGTFYGYIGQVEGIISRIYKEAKVTTKPVVVATGGLAELLAPETSMIDVVDPFLTLKGLKAIYEKNT